MTIELGEKKHFLPLHFGQTSSEMPMSPQNEGKKCATEDALPSTHRRNG